MSANKHGPHPTKERDFVMMEIGAIGDCSSCTAYDCPNNPRNPIAPGPGINPIFHPEQFEALKLRNALKKAAIETAKYVAQPIAAYVKVYSTRDLNYDELNRVRCSRRPLLFQESRNKIAMTGKPKPRETVLILRTGGIVSNFAGGVIIRVERGAFDDSWDDAMRREPNTVHSTGVYKVG